MFHEIPPTAGMPLSWRDFLAGPKAAGLETALAQFLEVESAQIECSGTAAFLIALEALKRLSSRKTVILPGYTCPLVPLAVSQAGLNVRVVDTQPDSFDFDCQALKAACDADTLCVVPTHIGGMVGDMQTVLDTAHGTGAYVIEDAAQALGAEWQTRKAGTIGDIGFFSLTRGKGLTIYEGGALVAKDRKMQASLRETAASLVKSKRLIEMLRFVELIGYKLFYNPFGLSFVYGMPLRHWLKKDDPLQAVGDIFAAPIELNRVSSLRAGVAASAIRRLPSLLSENRKRGKQRAAMLSTIPGVQALQEKDDICGTWPFLTVFLKSQMVRDQVLSRLWTKGLGVTRLFINDLAGYDYLREVVPAANLPNARSVAARMLTISNSEWLDCGQFDQIAAVIRTCAQLYESEPAACDQSASQAVITR